MHCMAKLNGSAPLSTETKYKFSVFSLCWDA